MPQKYISVKEQCWLKTCHQRASMRAKIKGKVRFLCPRHAEFYGNSAEKDS